MRKKNLRKKNLRKKNLRKKKLEKKKLERETTPIARYSRLVAVRFFACAYREIPAPLVGEKPRGPTATPTHTHRGL